MSATFTTTNHFNKELSRLNPLILLVVFLPPILVHLVFRLIAVMDLDFMPYSLTGFTAYVASLWLIFSMVMIYLRRRGITWQNLGLTNFRWSDFYWSAAAAILGFVMFYVSQLVADWLNLPAYQGLDYREVQGFNLIWVLLVCVLIGPLGEELLYRGLLLGWLWGRMKNPWLAGLLATLVFAIVHIPGFGLRGSLYILFWTPPIVALFIWRRSIYPGYEAHLVNNLVAYGLVPYLYKTF